MPFKIDFSKLDKKLASVVKEVERVQGEIMVETAEQAIKIIVQRTRRKNQDYQGKSFIPYSPAYSNKKRRDGANTRVNLTSTGQKKSGGKGSLKGNRQGGTMMNSLTIVRVEDRGAKQIISAARRPEQIKLARHVRGSGSLPKRNPLGFTSKEEKVLKRRASRQFIDKIQKIGQS